MRINVGIGSKELLGIALLWTALVFSLPADAVTNTWEVTGSLATAREYHTATLLPSGKVLVAGGVGNSGRLASAELYDPASNTWSAAGSLATVREFHTATLLPSGQVLVVGGQGNGGSLASAELYDPASNTWSTAGSLANARWGHTATLLPSGKVLVAGGFNAFSTLASAELYDPASNTWSAAGSLATARVNHTATLLPSGKVLVAGGENIASAELYDPVSNTWSAAGTLATAREYHTATLLPSGQVLVAGGNGSSGFLASVELCDPGLAPDPALQPDLNMASPWLARTSRLVAGSLGSAYVSGAIVATGFWPALEASGGATNNSASNTPVLQVQRIDNDQTIFVPNDETVALTDTSFTGSPTAFAGFPAGPVRVRAWVNGVPSATQYSVLATPPGAVAAPTAIGGDAQATVDFTPTAYDGGAPITYVATALPGGLQAQCTAPCASIVFNPIAAGTYAFVVNAENGAGVGLTSPLSNSTTVYPLDDIFHDGFEATP